MVEAIDLGEDNFEMISLSSIMTFDEDSCRQISANIRPIFRGSSQLRALSFSFFVSIFIRDILATLFLFFC